MNRLLCASALIGATLLGACDQTMPDPAATAAAATTGAAPEAGDRYAVGEARVHAIRDTGGPFPASLFVGATQAEVFTLLANGGEQTTDAQGQPAWNGSVWAFLVETGGKRVLIDTGGGAELQGQLAAKLRAAGVTPDQIDAIAISHMHSDHVGGLLDPAGKPVYPRATLHIHADEAGYWGDPAKAAQAPAEAKAMFEAARRVIAAYGDRVRTFSSAVEIAPGLMAEPLTGHTPGHSLYRLTSGDRQMVFIGDMIHSLAVQMPRPAVTLQFDSDADRARTARLAFLQANAGKGMLFAGPHFKPGVVTIDAAGEGYRANPASGS